LACLLLPAGLAADPQPIPPTYSKSQIAAYRRAKRGKTFGDPGMFMKTQPVSKARGQVLRLYLKTKALKIKRLAIAIVGYQKNESHIVK
jgi:hypothetical protein